MILAFTDHLFHGRQCVYVWTTVCTIIPALCDGLHGAGLKLGEVDNLLSLLPLAEYSMGWISFAIVGAVIGVVWMLATKEKNRVAEEA